MLQLPLYQSQTNFDKFSLLEMFGSFITVKPELAWLLAGLVGIFFIVLSFVLSYHWKRFGLEPAVMARMAILYFSVSSVLIVTLSISLVVYLNSL